MGLNFEKSNIKFRVLDDENIQDIFNTALDILERVGVKVYNNEAVEIFKKHGCTIENNLLVKIPSAVVLRSIASAPHRVSIFDRQGNLGMLLEDRRSYFGTGSDCMYIIDSFSNIRRKANLSDLRNCVKIIDALEGIDFCESTVLAQDIPEKNRYTNIYLNMVQNTTKPLLLTLSSDEDVRTIFDIASIISGSKDNFISKPSLIIYSQPNSPLYHTDEAIKKLMYCSKNNIPIVYTPCPISGATAPVTKAGTLVIALCETLSGLVLSQLINPGCRIITGTTISIFDMATTIMPYGNPELQIMSAALCEIARYLKLPVFTTAGCTDSKTLDGQAALEFTDTIMMAALSGGNLVHDLGYMESSMTTCNEALLLCSEIVLKTRKTLEGIIVNEETLMREEINNIKPGGNYLTDDSTINMYRKEFYFPKLFNRDPYPIWEKNGSKTLNDLLNKRIVEILKNHVPPGLDRGIKEEIYKFLNTQKIIYDF